MTTLYSVSGQRIYIGSQPVDLPDEDLVAADFDTVTWIEIKNWIQMGALGDAAALITTPLIDRGRDVKQKGTRNAGQMQNNFGIARSDAGQIAIRAAEATDLNYPFKILGNDEPAVGSAPTPSQRLCYGLVTAASEAGGAANTVQALNTTVEVNTNIVTVAPSAGSAPVNTVLPSIAGIAQQGVLLHANLGSWTGGVDSYVVTWKNEGVNTVPPATGLTYTPVAADVGDNLTISVAATNTAGTTTAVSAETTPVLAP